MIFSDISDSDLTSDNYKHFLGARLAKDNNIVKTCAFRMPDFSMPRENVNTKCYNVDISQNRIERFLTYDYTKIVPEKEITKTSKY